MAEKRIKMDPKTLKKTQDTLGKLIKKPPLTEKLLSKPPFRFLHDVMTSVIKTTGFMQGLYSDTEMNSENVKDKDAKIAFLQKAIDIVAAVTGKSLSVKPVKIVAGHEPERTNEFLQALADAINKNVDNDQYVRQVLKGGGGGGGGSSAKEEKHESHKDKEREKDRDRTKSADRRKQRDSEKEKPEKEKDGERSRDKGDRERSRDKGDKDRDRDKDRERRHEKDRDRHKDRESKTRDKSRDDREDRHREKSKKKQPSSKLSEDTKEGEIHHSKVSSSSKKASASGIENVGTLGLEDSLGPPATLSMGDDGGAGHASTSPHKHRNAVPSLPIGSCRRPGAKLPPPVASHAESLATGDHSFIGLSDHREKENESLEKEKVNGEKVEKQEAPSRLQRPSSAKGSRRRREGKH
ncbi:hypothetical protein RRG08_045690 [Elysia crispata]|uniref:TRAF3-interacting protein 1 n=1 Tax=Elysia crispata TaxID=231223 RepID=A0AAE0Z287_9GAST|nr:hypothetical protein RRG08_045690 [Elysia crispata]